MGELLGESNAVDCVIFSSQIDGKVNSVYEGGFREVVLPVRGSVGGIFGWFKQVVALRRYLKKLQKNDKPYDIIHAQIAWKAGFTAMVLSKWFGIPYVVTEHYTGYMPEDGTLSGFRLYLSLFALNKASGIAAVSEGLRKAMMNAGVKKEINVIPNVIHNEFLQADVIQRNPGNKVRFLHISNFDDRQKQTSYIISQFLGAQINFPEIELTLVVPEDKWLHFISASVIDPQSINFIPSGLDKQELRRIYEQHDVLVSFSSYETFGLTIAEGLCMGLPAIYTPCGGPEYYVQAAAGIQTDSAELDTLLAAFRNIAQSYPYNNIKIAEQARKTFNRQAVAEAYQSLYGKALQ